MFKMFISDFFQREIEFYRGKYLCSYFDHVAKIQENKKWKQQTFRSSVFL